MSDKRPYQTKKANSRTRGSTRPRKAAKEPSALWFNSMSDVGLATFLWAEGRPAALSIEQLQDLENVVRDALRRKSQESRVLPADAGAIVRAAMPDLWLQIEFVRLKKERHTPIRRKTQLTQLRKIAAAQLAVRKIKELLHGLIARSSLSGFPVIAGAQGSAWAAVIRMEADYEALIRRVKAEAILANRPADLWTSAVATTVALWWLQQGWTPSSQADGAFASVVRTLRSYRFDDVDVPEPGRSLILVSIEDARGLHQLGYPAMVAEAIAVGFRESQLLVPWSTGPKPPDKT